MNKEDFGDRMKEYESAETSRKFISLLPIYARIDGRSFSKFTKELERPFDINMSIAMIETTRLLVEKTHARIGYTQSDEISLVWCQEEYDSDILFTGKIQKMCSVLAGMASSIFMHQCWMSIPLRRRAMVMHPAFDCRVFQLPNKMEAANCFLWREKDATKNAVSMAARSFYPHKDLQGKNGSEMQEMMFQRGQNFNDYPPFFKRGTFLQKRFFDFTTDKDYPTVPMGTVVQRSRIEEIEMPSFTTVKNRVEVIFDGEEPIV